MKAFTINSHNNEILNIKKIFFIFIFTTTIAQKIYGNTINNENQFIIPIQNFNQIYGRYTVSDLKDDADFYCKMRLGNHYSVYQAVYTPGADDISFIANGCKEKSINFLKMTGTMFYSCLNSHTGSIQGDELLSEREGYLRF